MDQPQLVEDTGTELARFSRPMLDFAAVVTVIIMIVGVLGNVLTLVVLSKDRKLRTVAAAFIASLCISDLLFCVTVLPFAISRFINGDWKHGHFLCSVVPLVRYGNVGVSLLSVAMISINRYILIAWPQLYGTIYRPIRVVAFVSLCWMLSFGMQIPTLLGVWGKFGYDEKLGTCSILRDENGRSSKSTLFVIGFAIPCIIIVVCYARIYWVVKRSHARLQKHGTSGTNTKKSEWNITRMVLAIFLCFLTCYLPITVAKVCDPNVNYPTLHILGYLLLYLASCLNPVIYVTMNKQYRQAYKTVLICGDCLQAERSMRANTSHANTAYQDNQSRTFMSVVFSPRCNKHASQNPS